MTTGMFTATTQAVLCDRTWVKKQNYKFAGNRRANKCSKTACVLLGPRIEIYFLFFRALKITPTTTPITSPIPTPKEVFPE